MDGTRSCAAAPTLPRGPRLRPATIELLELSLVPFSPRLWGDPSRRPRVTPAIVRSVTGAALRLEVAGDRAVDRSAKQPGPKRAPSVRERRAATGEPVVTVSKAANGSITVKGSSTTRSGAGEVRIDSGITRTVDGRETQSSSIEVKLPGGASVGVDLTFAGGGLPSCPKPDGTIAAEGSLSKGVSTVEEGADGYSAKRTVRLSLSSSVDARLDVNAVLGPIRFDVSAGIDVAASAKVGPVQVVQRVVARGTYAGVADPRSGAVSGGALSITTSASGMLDGAGAREEARSSVERILRDQVARLVDEARAVEQRARGGECTQLTFEPGSPAELAAGETTSVRARLETTEGGRVTTVRWQASPGKGTVEPRSSSGAEPTFTVTAASRGPETGRVTVKATSPAGISEETWVAKEGDFPLTYSGTVQYSSNGPGPQTEEWRATVTYTRKTQSSFPDGTRTARYELTSATVTGHKGTLDSCTYTVPDGGTISFGDLELQVSPDGAWRGAFVVDVKQAPTTLTCPPPAPPVPYPTPKAFLNSGSSGAEPLRPMPARGPITARGVTDLNGLGITASWNLTPSEK